jgi:diaminopimelate epimerase
MVGGDVIISWQGQAQQVLMEGDAAYSFYGQIMIET